jgi:prephenate dehydrogenase
MERPPLPDMGHLSICVVGMGLIGGSVLRSLPGARGWDASPRVRDEACSLGYDVPPRLEDALVGADAVLVATPLPALAQQVILALRSCPQATVLDTGSSKERLLRSVLEGAPRDASRYVPAHPLAGAPQGGFGASHPDLLDDAPWALCPHEGLDEGHLWRALLVISALGGHAIGIEAHEHDEVVALSSHVPYLVSGALATCAPPHLAGRVASLHGGSLHRMTSPAQSPPALWRDILESNCEGTLTALRAFLGRLEDLCLLLEDGDWDDLEQGLAAGRDASVLFEAERWGPCSWERESWERGHLAEHLLSCPHGACAEQASLEGDLFPMWARRPFSPGPAV